MRCLSKTIKFQSTPTINNYFSTLHKKTNFYFKINFFIIFFNNSGTQLCFNPGANLFNKAKGYCRNGVCEETAKNIVSNPGAYVNGGAALSSNQDENWCYYYDMCDYSASTCGNNKLELGEDCDGGSCCTNECKLKATAHCNYETYSFASGVKVTTTNECCTEYCKPR